MRSQLDPFAQENPQGLQDGLWGLKQTNSVYILVNSHWEEDFQEKPKGLTDMDTLALGQQGQHIPCVHSSHSWPSPWLWVSTVNCQNQQSSVPLIVRTFNKVFSLPRKISSYTLHQENHFSSGMGSSPCLEITEHSAQWACSAIEASATSPMIWNSNNQT